ncbi:BMP family lipoprotein [Cellulosilyticum ruminicola]|uniref:BMP family lipoprotein n=1 Tax=Cellulosilyticum ruminicola TaxID=425254 RepID=UPI0006D1987D|nr:BMP family ABC transporter substrate-binding protein [Cellulosilyticum ruminicola]
MKKFLALGLSSILAMSVLAGCGGSANGGQTETTSKFEKLDTDLKVGMVVGKGTIDDRSFNQGTWEGISGTVKNCKYLKPAGETEADYTKEIGNLYDAGFKSIMLPGYYFETALFKAQDKYTDASFVILDGEPNDGQGTTKIGDKTVSITFAEQEASFIAGVAAATQIKDGEFGFLGGMALPAVQRFEKGFRQGIDYANTNLGTNISFKDENSVYQGTFDDKAAGQQIAAQMYDRGVKVIFTAAGGTGIGAITEAKQRTSNGQEVWVIGVDSDQYTDGIYNEDTKQSVVLTSAIKYLDQATHDMIVAQVNGNFQGGEVIVFSIANDGVGIPAENPNLSEETIIVVNEVYNKVKTGEIVVDGTV